jgi:hypothetical protein
MSLLLAFCLKDAMSLLNTRLASYLSKAIKHSSIPLSSRTSTPTSHHSINNPILPTTKHFSQSTHNMSPAAKMTSSGGAQAFFDTMVARRTFYALNKSGPVPQSRIEEIIRHAILHVPSSFNSQSTRIVLLVGEEHDKLWEIAKESVKAVAPPEMWSTSEKKLNGFKAGYGTVCLTFPSILRLQL